MIDRFMRWAGLDPFSEGEREKMLHRLDAETALNREAYQRLERRIGPGRLLSVDEQIRAIRRQGRHDGQS